jgi:peroxiredoxin
MQGMNKPSTRNFRISSGLLTALGLMLFALGCSKTEPGKSESTSTGQTPQKLETGRQVLETAAAAYRRAKTYSDRGIVRKTLESAGNKTPEEYPFLVEYSRPGTLRIEAYQIKIVVKGGKYFASMDDFPDQVVEKDAPPKLNMNFLYNDPLLANALLYSAAGAPPQILFLLEDRPLDILLQHTEEPRLAEPDTIDGRPCYQVQVGSDQDGWVSLWIDRENFLLRRMIRPTREVQVPGAAGAGNEPVKISVAAEFNKAQFDATVPPFQYEVPAGAVAMRTFAIAPVALLGKKVPDFKFVDLDEHAVVPSDLSGKVAVLAVWAYDDPETRQACFDNLSRLQEVQKKYHDSKKVAFYTLNLDPPQVHNAILKDALERANIHLPLLRDPNFTARKLAFVPAVLLIGPDGTLQDFESGPLPNLAASLPQKIEDLLAGKNLSAECLKKLQENAPPSPIQEAPRSEPKTFRRTLLWRCPDVKLPGNILVLQDPNAPPRLAVVDGLSNAIVEVGTDGKPLATHPLQLDPKQEMITNLRATTDAKGNRWIAAFAGSYQRCFLFDKDWKQVLAYPADALEHPHAGISDVALGDLDGDGTPEMYVAYWGVVGVQAVSLEGKLLWPNRSVSNVASLAIGPADEKGHRTLICANGDGTLVALDAKGQRVAEASVPNFPLRCLIDAELAGSGAVQWCGLSMPKPGETAAVGLNLDGKLLWQYKLPPGMPTKPVEKIVPGRLSPSGPGLWMLPCPDGSLHFLAADGKLLDRFNYGAAAQGLATVEAAGRMLLIVASADALEAWKIEE